jgi:hypothetical protein
MRALAATILQQISKETKTTRNIIAEAMALPAMTPVLVRRLDLQMFDPIFGANCKVPTFLLQAFTVADIDVQAGATAFLVPLVPAAPRPRRGHHYKTKYHNIP